MERRVDLSNIDLDEVAAAVGARSTTWAGAEIVVDAITWMDYDDEWPRPLLTDRHAARRPMSVGVELSRHDRAGALIVVYAGGWADADAVVRGLPETLSEYTELDEPSDVEPILDRVVEWLIRHG